MNSMLSAHHLPDALVVDGGVTKVGSFFVLFSLLGKIFIFVLPFRQNKQTKKREDNVNTLLFLGGGEQVLRLISASLLSCPTAKVEIKIYS